MTQLTEQEDAAREFVGRNPINPEWFPMGTAYDACQLALLLAILDELRALRKDS